MSIVQNQSTLHGKQDIYSEQESVCATPKKQTGANSKTATPNHSERMQKFCGDGKFSEYVLSRTTEIVKTYI